MDVSIALFKNHQKGLFLVVKKVFLKKKKKIKNQIPLKEELKMLYLGVRKKVTMKII